MEGVSKPGLEPIAYYRGLKSHLDYAIVEALIRMKSASERGTFSADVASYVLKGVPLRFIRYAIGAYEPAQSRAVPGWLDDIRNALTAAGTIDPSFTSHSVQTVSNHCNKLRKMGVLIRDNGNYRLGPNAFDNAEALRRLRYLVKRGRQTDTRSDGMVTVVDLSKLDRPVFKPGAYDYLRSEVRKFADRLSRDMVRDYYIRKESTEVQWGTKWFLDFPLVVIDINGSPELLGLADVRDARR